uniref:Ig-like domain-containing protein n=1 Tax=Xenopus tropicalis TaxID=8364 RepID=A0A6I8S9B7_XENTR
TVTAVRPVISLSPNWTPIFPGESVTLSCNVAPTAQGNLGYSWYRDGYWIRGDEQSLTGVTDRGDYQCQAGASERSDNFRLDVSSGWLILQAPPAVHEGDSLSLRCHSRPEYRAWNPVFYKDNKPIGSPVSGSELHIGRVGVTASGTYRCEKKMCYYCYTTVTTLTADRTITVTGKTLNIIPVQEIIQATLQGINRVCHHNITIWSWIFVYHFMFMSLLIIFLSAHASVVKLLELCILKRKPLLAGSSAVCHGQEDNIQYNLH